MPQEQDQARTVAALPTPLLESQPTLLCDDEDSKCCLISDVHDGKVAAAQPRRSDCSPASLPYGRRQSADRSAQGDGRPCATPTFYGELVVLGYNGSLPAGDKGRKRSKFPLYQRATANGVKPIKTHHIINNPRDQKVIQERSHNSVSYTLSRNESVIVEYGPDGDTDMFQVGRASDDSIDCVVVDTVAGSASGPLLAAPVQSTISRFACRIIIERSPPHRARIFAAGFDSRRNIMLGEKASKWYREGEIDGLTTNGIQLMHPLGEYSDGGTPGVWREVSVGGSIYALRGTRSVPNSSAPLVEVGGTSGNGNVLRDGTLIDLCGATLVWRSADGLAATLSAELLEREIERLNAGRPQCPVGLNTLAFVKRRGRPDASGECSSRRSIIEEEQQPYVYISCGHVHGAHRWGAAPAAIVNQQQQQAATAARVCPLCMKSGPFIPVQVGSETSVYVDRGSPTTHCFVPCAHMASWKTVKYWSSVAIPYGCQGFRAMCPFCATPLAGDIGYVSLIFQNMDT